jgi:acyl-CoA reductase-like NAD-dependent aldehyde dehydrogenase
MQKGAEIMSVVEDVRSTFAVSDPVSGEKLYEVTEPDAAALDAVYARAHTAYELVRKMTVRQRLDECGKLLEYIRENRESILDRVIAETGKTRYEALISEIFAVLDMIGYYQQHAEKMLADRPMPTPLLLMGKKGKIVFEPIGPVLCIAPWNFPFNQAITFFLCPFIAGNPVILKPSEFTPLMGLVEDIFAKAGVMKDAIQVVYGGRDTGRQLIDRRPAKIFFTGSTRAGKEIMAHAAQYLIPVELELGGKDPMLVFDDVDVERTVNGCLWGGVSNAGQTCTAIERVYVQEPLYDKFVSELKSKIEKLRTPAGASPKDDRVNMDVGAMTTEFQLQKVEEQLAHAKEAGATVTGTGKRIDGTQCIAPTLVTNAPADSPIWREETFGPVIAVTKFKTEEEAIALANDCIYGLSSSVWSRDLARAERVARRMACGQVSINNILSTQAHSGLPFGGTKESGFGRFKGEFGLHSFSNVKSIMTEPQSNKLEVNWFPYSKEKYVAMTNLILAAFTPHPLRLVRTALAGIKLEGLAKKQRL